MVDASLFQNYHPIRHFLNAQDGFVVAEPAQLQPLTSTVTKVVIKDHCCNDPSLTSWSLTACVSLKELFIGDGCFKYCASFSVSQLPKLTKIEIGVQSFVLADYTLVDELNMNPRPGSFEVTDCTALQSLSIGRYSFAASCSCRLSSCDCCVLFRHRFALSAGAFVRHETGHLVGMFLWSKLRALGWI